MSRCSAHPRMRDRMRAYTCEKKHEKQAKTGVFLHSDVFTRFARKHKKPLFFAGFSHSGIFRVLLKKAGLTVFAGSARMLSFSNFPTNGSKTVIASGH